MKEKVIGTMPKHDVEETVFYYKEQKGVRVIDIEEYETALGLGAVYIQTGVCIE